MSYKIDGTKITLTRGDTFRTVVAIKNKTEGSYYTPTEGESVVFAMKRNRLIANGSEYYDKAPLIEKEIPIDTMILHITPEDTKSLGFGEYKYDVRLVKANGEVYTFISDSDFIIDREAH